MFILIAFAFIAGIVTILSPCILPILPIILSSSTGTDPKKPYGVVAGFIASFTFFTLFLTTLVRWFNISPDFLRFFSVIIIAGFGASLLIPKVQVLLEQLFAKLSGLTPQTTNYTGFGGGLLIGLSLGLIWTPCVGPILASVITLALTGSVNTTALFITLAYSIGTAIPMFVIIRGGQSVLQNNQWLVRNTANIQKAFGVLMILTALMIHFNIDRKFQSYILETFPRYGAGLTSFEDNELIRNQLQKINSKDMDDRPATGSQTLDQMLNEQVAKAPAIIPGGEWLNLEQNGYQQPPTLEDLRGRVVLIDFWTYSCINCIRTLPYLNRWHDTYQDDGLTIIGVHSPEFEFEKDVDNLTKAMADYGTEYLVVQDNNFDTWKNYNNLYWPAKYLIDKNGTIRYTHFGEGKYDETEEMIQKLLMEDAQDLSFEAPDNPDYQIHAQTPELYLGYKRINNFVSPERPTPDRQVDYTVPTSQRPSSFALSGLWTITPEYSTPGSSDSTLTLNFRSKEVFLVMRSSDGQPANANLTLDGKQVDNITAGDDTKEGSVTITTDRLYHLISLPQPGSHTLTIEFTTPNIEIFAFTFG